MLTVPQFESRLKLGEYKRQADARRAAFHLQVPERVREKILENIDQHFGQPWAYSRADNATRAAANRPTATLGEAAKAKADRERERAWRAEAGRKGGLARQANRKANAQKAAAARWQKHQQPLPEVLQELPKAPPSAAKLSGAEIQELANAVVASMPPQPPPSVVALPTTPAAPVVVDLKVESDRMVRELAEKLAPTAMPDGSEQACRMLMDSTRELFAVLAEEARADESLRPDMIRVAHVASGLAELGAEILRDRVRRTPPAPASTPGLAEAAQ